MKPLYSSKRILAFILTFIIIVSNIQLIPVYATGEEPKELFSIINFNVGTTIAENGITPKGSNGTVDLITESEERYIKFYHNKAISPDRRVYKQVDLSGKSNLTVEMKVKTTGDAEACIGLSYKDQSYEDGNRKNFSWRGTTNGDWKEVKVVYNLDDTVTSTAYIKDGNDWVESTTYTHKFPTGENNRYLILRPLTNLSDSATVCFDDIKAYYTETAAPTIAAEKVTINEDAESVSIEAGKTVELTATVTPDNATDKTVAWSSDNSDVATVDAATGVVTGVSAGSVTITATVGTDITDTITVNVIEPTSEVEPEIYFYNDFDGTYIGEVSCNSKTKSEKIKVGGDYAYKISRNTPSAWGAFYLTATMGTPVPKETESIIVEVELSTNSTMPKGYFAYPYNGKDNRTDTLGFSGLDIKCKSVDTDSVATITPGEFQKVGMILNLTTGSYTVHLYDKNSGKWGEAVGSGTNSVALQDEMTFIRVSSVADLDVTTGDLLIDNFAVYSGDEFLEDVASLIPKAGETIMPMDSPYAAPPVTPPANEHPRVMFTKDDIPTIQANMNSAENAAAYASFNYLKGQEYDGLLIETTTSNYDANGLAIIEAKAFDYVINDNTENGEAAITALKNYLKTFVTSKTGSSMYYRESTHVLFTAAEVYDWCFDLLDATEREYIVARCQYISTFSEIGFPPSKHGPIADHGNEAPLLRDWLALAIATYDEYPFIWNYVAGRYYEEFLPARDYFYKSGAHYQGSSYGPLRFYFDLFAQLLLSNMSKDDSVDKVLCEGTEKIAYQWVYARRPDGELLRDGDDSHEKLDEWYSYTNRIYFLASNFYKDGVLKKEYLRNASFSAGHSNLSAVQVLAINDPSIELKEVEALPLTKYISSPIGAMFARTGWNMGVNSRDVLAYMKIGEVWTANHNHKDAGNFQIYYKGILASESGAYVSYRDKHDENYNKSSIAHNTLAITSTANPTGVQRILDGSQSSLDSFTSGMRKSGEVIGQEYGPDIYTPEYTYIAGDIADAYDDNVQEAVRSMLFMPLENEVYPAAFVVFDRITTVEADSKKTFMLHMQTEPTINGNVTTITNAEDDYNGMLTNQTLLPANPIITKLEGFMVGDTNYEPDTSKDTYEKGWGRVEISTTTTEQNQTDYFLNVMYVNDADKSLALEEAELIDAENVVGAKIFNRVAMFNKEKARTDAEITFTIPTDADVTSYSVNVAGLKDGTWTITTANGTQTTVATEDGGIVYFDAPAGTCTLTRTSDENVKTPTSNTPEVEAGIDLRLNLKYLYAAVKPEKSGEKVYIPVKVLFDAINKAVITENGDSISISWLGATLNVANDSAMVSSLGATTVETTDVIAKDGDFLVPMSFLTEVFGNYLTIEWNPISSIVDVTATIVDPYDWSHTYENAIPVFLAKQSGDDGTGNDISHSIDGSLSSRWAVSNKNGEAWGIYDLVQVYKLDEVLMSFNKGDSRLYLFDFEVSTDGKNYTPVITGKTNSGESTALESYDMGDVEARYVKFRGHGYTNKGATTGGEWSNIFEIIFIGTPAQKAEPSPTPEVTPSPTPEVTPSPAPEVTPSPTPEATPSPTPIPHDDEDDDDIGSIESSDSTADAAIATGQPATGDSSNIAFWSVVLIFAFIGSIVAGTIYRKKF